MIKIDKNICPQNHPCPAVMVCPFGAMTQNGFSAPIIDQEKCTSCGKCERFCPMGAIRAVKEAEYA